MRISSLQRRIAGQLAAVLLPATFGACGGSTVDGAEQLGENGSSIINGTVVASDPVGFALLSSESGGCSSTILTPIWVLTADHCVASSTPAGTTATLGTSTTTRTAAAFFRNPTFDVALVRLASPFPTTAYPTTHLMNPLYGGSTTSLVGQQVNCFGYGNDSASGGFGTLRTAQLTVWSQNQAGTEINIQRNANDQIQSFGDSGSSCSPLGSPYRVAGVASTVQLNGFPTPTVASLVSVAAFRDWANRNIAGTCTAESNATFCARVAKNCGTVTGTDNCGNLRVADSCGTCSSPQVCGGGGTANVCGGNTNLCIGVTPWDPNKPWFQYTVGERHTGSDNKLYQCNSPGFCYLDPAGPNGHFGWAFVTACS
jgi:hypothetical protein